MKLKNKLEVEETLEVGVIPNATTSNFSVVFEIAGLFQRRQVGTIINKNDNEYLPSVSNAFPSSVFVVNASTTHANPNLTVSFVNQVAGSVFAAPQSLNGTPAFRMLQDSDLSQTSLSSKQNQLTNGLHTTLNGNKVDVAFDANTFVKDKANNDRLLFGNTQPTDVVIQGAVANGDFKVKDSTGADMFRMNGSNKVPYFPQLPAPQTGASNNLAIFDTGNGLWKSNLTIGDLVTTSVLSNYYTKTEANSNFHKLAKNTTEAQNGGYYGSFPNVDANNILGNVSLWAQSTGATNIPGNSHLISFGVSPNYGFQIIKNQLPTSAPIIRTRYNGNWSEEAIAYQSWVTQQIANAGTNYITTNTNQTGLSGDKTSSGIYTLGQIRKTGQNDTQILLAGGGHRPVSDFALAGSLGSYLPLAGGTMTGSINSNNPQVIQYGGNTILYGSGVSTIIGGVQSTSIIELRPHGYGTTTNRVVINNAGTIATSNHGDSSQWKQAYDWGNHALAGYALSSQLSGYVPTTRTLTINGTTLDLSANRTWTIPDNDTITRLRGTTSGVFTSGDLTLINGAGIGVSQSGANFTITNSSPNVQSDWNATSGLAQILNKPPYGTTANTIAEGNDVRINNGQTAFNSLVNYLPLAGGTMTGIINFATTNTQVIRWGNVDKLNISATVTVLAANATTNSTTNGVIFRPSGASSATNQVLISGDGLIRTSLHGNSSQWKQAFDWGNHALAGYALASSVPAQVNLTQGTGIGITGTYPNLTITNSAPNIIQTLSQSGQVVTLSNGGGSFTLPIVPTYTTDTLAILNSGTSTTGALQSSKNLNDWLNGKSYTTLPLVQAWIGTQNFSTQTLTNSTSNLIVSNTVQRAALTGDVTAAQNSNATTIATSAVTFPKIQNITTQTLLGRATAGTGNVEELTATDVKTILGLPDFIGNGTFTVQGTGALTGIGSTSANASVNTTADLDLTQATKDDIQQGVNANTIIPSIVDGVNFRNIPSNGNYSIQIQKKKTIVNVSNGVLGAVLSIDDGLYDGYELAINGCTEWLVELIGNIQDKCQNQGSVSHNSSVLYWWSEEMGMWIQAI